MRITIDDAELDVRIEGKGRAIVLLHAFPVSRDEYDAQAARLAADALVIRPDLRGMGRSSVPDGPYLMETLAGDVAAILDALGIESACIAGHSLGGYVAMAFARMHMERVERLALICSRLAADTEETARSREALANRVETENSMEPIVEAYLPRMFAPHTYESGSGVAMHAKELALRNTPRGGAAMLRGMAQRVNSYDIAEDIDVPVLVAAGEKDCIVPLSEAREMQRAFPRATLKTLANTGHLPTLEEPDTLTDLLTAFVCEKD